jgi:hypothetical protein
MPDMRDPYAPVAEYVALMSLPSWQSFGTVLENVLEYAGGGPVLDIGTGMVGHLPPADRAALWERLAAVLSPGAPAVFTLQPPEHPELIPEQPFDVRSQNARLPAWTRHRPTVLAGAICPHDQGLAQHGNYADHNAPVSHEGGGRVLALGIARVSA